MNTGNYTIEKFQGEENKAKTLSNLQTCNPRKLEYLICQKVNDLDAALVAVREAISQHMFPKTNWYSAPSGGGIDIKMKFSLALGRYVEQGQSSNVRGWTLSTFN